MGITLRASAGTHHSPHPNAAGPAFPLRPMRHADALDEGGLVVAELARGVRVE